MSSSLTSNRNFLTPVGFKLTMDSTRYGNVEYFITTVMLPTITLGEISTPFRNRQGYMPDDKVGFDTLTVRMLIDEDMNNYREIFDWLNNNALSAGKLEFCDMTLNILSSKSKVNKQVRFTSAFPTAINGVEFNTQNSDIEYLQADVTFRFDEMSFIS
jgi:hypothetical protein